MLKGKTIEEIVNRWSTELETHVREFNKFAGEVAVWDRTLIESGRNLAALYSHVLAAEREQNDIDQSLDHIEQQQKDLSATLDAYEKSTDEILGGQGGSLRALDTGPADNERDKNYMLATELHTHLDDLSGSLTQMIDSVNSLSLPSSASADGKTQQGEDPMAQIAQILSSHLESLQWIDGAVREVEGKVTEVEKGIREAGIGSSLSGANKSRGFGLNR
jgi:nuclear pore complex protein Nup62